MTAITGCVLVRNSVATAPTTSRDAETISGLRTSAWRETTRAATADSRPIGISTSPACVGGQAVGGLEPLGEPVEHHVDAEQASARCAGRCG